MTQMFCSCANLKELNLTGFDVSKVKNMNSMFTFSQNLTTIYCDGNWKEMATGLTDSQNMFAACNALKGDNNTIYTSSNPQDITYARPDGGTEAPGYFSKKSDEGIESIVAPTDKAQKIMMDGQLYIATPDGKIFNTQGARVR